MRDEGSGFRRVMIGGGWSVFFGGALCCTKVRMNWGCCEGMFGLLTIGGVE